MIEAKSSTRLAFATAELPVLISDIAENSVFKTMKQQREIMLTAMRKRIFVVEYKVLTKRFLSISGQVDMRSDDIREDRSFGYQEETKSSSIAEEQQTEVISDPDSLSDVVEEADAKEYCFFII